MADLCEIIQPASCLETGDPPAGWGVRRTNFEFDLELSPSEL